MLPHQRSESVIPTVMRLANISSIWKRKSSKQDLDNDRGIFVLCVLRKICDKLVYNDLYPELEANMSNSNIGAMKNKNIRNHLFVVYGIINSVVRGESPCVDIQIFDLKKCFDALWLEDVMNDLYEAVPHSGQNDKLALLYKSNYENQVSVKTAVGQTRRVNMPKIVMQGGSWGPLQCSNSIDKIGKECEENREHLYTYKKLVKVPILSMVDDKLAFSTCGQESLSLNAHINTHIELKKLEFHTPDARGKSKCHKMHVGQSSTLCPDLKVHNSSMELVSEDTYLGDVVRSDGRNISNIQHRVSKGIGIVSQIMKILETISFGKCYYQIAFSLREAMFINGILTNAEIWYGVTKSEIEALELVDRLLIRRILSLPMSTCTEALYLETGCLDIETIIKGRRIKFVHYLVNSDRNSMLYKFFKVQWDFSCRGDWTRQCKEDLQDFDIPDNLEYFEGKSQDAFKKMVTRKTKDYALEKFKNMKMPHSKMDNLHYTELKLQSFLELKELSVEESKTILLWRLRMAKFGANYGEKYKLCPLCKKHEDNQEKCFNQCEEVRKTLTIKCNYEDIFRSSPSQELASVLKEIMKIRESQP